MPGLVCNEPFNSFWSSELKVYVLRNRRSHQNSAQRPFAPDLANLPKVRMPLFWTQRRKSHPQKITEWRSRRRISQCRLTRKPFRLFCQFTQGQRAAVVDWFLNVPATWICTTGMDLLRQLYMLPNWDRSCRKTRYLSHSQYAHTLTTSRNADPRTPDTWKIAFRVPVFQPLVWPNQENRCYGRCLTSRPLKRYAQWLQWAADQGKSWNF